MAVGVSSCKKDKLLVPVCEDNSTPTYDDNIKTLINTSCAKSGCHGSGSSNGDYTSYAGISSDLTNGRFENRVLKDQTMPKGSTLSQGEINQFQCWLENNFAEN